LHVVVHADGGGLVDADVHGFADETPPDEMGDEIPGDGAQPFRPCQQRVLPTESPGELALGILVELSFFEQPGELLGEVVVDEL